MEMVWGADDDDDNDNVGVWKFVVGCNVMGMV